MGILSDFFIADDSTVPNYAGGENFDAADKCPLRELTPLQGAQFLTVLRGCEYDVRLIKEFRLITPEDADDWTMLLPPDMTAKLAALTGDQIPQTAAAFAVATSEELGWSTEEFMPIVTDLAALARRAIATGKPMYLWNCL